MGMKSTLSSGFTLGRVVHADAGTVANLSCCSRRRCWGSGTSGAVASSSIGVATGISLGPRFLAVRCLILRARTVFTFLPLRFLGLPPPSPLSSSSTSSFTSSTSPVTLMTCPELMSFRTSCSTPRIRRLRLSMRRASSLSSATSGELIETMIAVPVRVMVAPTSTSGVCSRRRRAAAGREATHTTARTATARDARTGGPICVAVSGQVAQGRQRDKPGRRWPPRWWRGCILRQNKAPELA